MPRPHAREDNHQRDTERIIRNYPAPEAVVFLHTRSPYEAIERAREAVQLCRAASDLQGEAYAALTLKE